MNYALMGRLGGRGWGGGAGCNGHHNCFVKMPDEELEAVSASFYMENLE